MDSAPESSKRHIDEITEFINGLADNLLLFFDDVLEISEKDERLLNSLKCNVVITSRLDEANLANAMTVRVESLHLDSCIHLYKVVSEQGHDDEIVKEIVMRTAQIPFAIKLFADTAREIKATDAEMLDIIIRNEFSLSKRYLDGELDLYGRLENIRQKLNELKTHIRFLQRHSANVNSAVYSDDQQNVLSASGDNTIREWDRNTGECLRIFEGHSSFVRSVVYSNDGLSILSASEDNTIREWDRDTGACRRVFDGHSSYVRSAVYSSDGRRILSASKDTTVLEWDRESGACLRVFAGHDSSVRCVVYSPDGRFVLSASGDQTVREWDRETGECVRIFRGHTAYVYYAAYSPDGRRVLSASGDDSIREWIEKRELACVHLRVIVQP